MSQDFTIAIRSLNHFLGVKHLRKQILFDINLVLRRGEVVILTGPSGAGKTTLLTLVGALRSVQHGSLQFLGQELRGGNPAQLVRIRRNIGYIFQTHNLLPFLSARQNVQMALENHRTISERDAHLKAALMLQAVSLGKYLNSYPHQLSVGQQQRVAIARALVNHPQLILADEPTASLDSKTGRDVVELMHRLAKESGCTILMVTHDNRILDIADRQLRMEDGRLVTQR
jgi:putative ABC transport system ATP-binding protein